MPSDDEIMAEHLLHGARMLARACPDCGCPLFEVKGETRCVVCDAHRVSAGESPGEAGAPLQAEPASYPAAPSPHAPGALGAELEATLACLLARTRDEPDPGRCYTLMKCVRLGWSLLGDQ